MKNITRFTLFVFLLSTFGFLNAQVGINSDDSDPDPSAMLDVKSTDKGMLVPRMDSTARNAILNPADGLLVYDSTTTSFWYFDEEWNEIGGQRVVKDGLLLDGDCSPESPVLTDSVSFPPASIYLCESLVNREFTHSGTEEYLYSIEIYLGGTVLNLGFCEDKEPLESGTLRIIEGNDPNGPIIHTQAISLPDVDAWNEVVIDVLLPITTNSDYIIQVEEPDGEFTWGIDPNDEYIFRAYAFDCRELFIIEPTTDSQTVSLSNIDTIRFSNGVEFDGVVSTLQDDDKDTKIQVEESEDEDIIRFDVAGEEKWRMENNTFIPVNEGNGIFIGENAGVSDSLLFDEGFGSMRTTENIFIGNSAGFNNTTGINNTVIGNSSFFSSTTGQSNIAIGTWALRRDTSGSGNVAIGISALDSNNGSSNVAIGAQAARYNQSGDGNVIIGEEALIQQRSGSNNVAVGQEAGGGNIPHDKSNSTYIGYNAGMLNQGNDNIFIGSKVASSIDWIDVDSTLAIDISDTSDPLIYGEFNNGLVRINGDLEVTGSFPDTDDQTLSFDGTNLSIVDGNSVDISSIDTDTDDQTLSFDGTNLSIVDGNSVDISSVNSVQGIIKDADSDTKIQVEESADEDMIRFDIEGDELFRMKKNTNGRTLLSVSDGYDNIYIGDSVAITDNSNVAERPNTIIGNHSLKNNTTGFGNVALGYKNLENNTSGFGNIAIGNRYVLQQNIGGDSNLAIGARALQNNTSGRLNLGIGDLAGENNQGGDENVLIGAFSGKGTTLHNKSGNVMIGVGAGLQNEGNGNIFLGHDAGRTETGSNMLYIENSISSSPLIYGEFNNNLVRINGDLEVTGSFPDTDDQTIDKLNLNGTTLELSLEDDGEVDQTVDLASIDTDTDDQTIDKLNLNGTTLELSLEDDGEVDQTVDLASIDTDDQTIDNFTLNGTTLELSLENDGQATQVVDLSSLVPVGTIQMWVTDTPPTGWLICDGSSFNTSTYPALQALLNSNKVPDLRRRFPLGAQEAVPQGETNRPLKSTGGEETVTLDLKQIPAHTHGIQYREGSESGSSNNNYSDLGNTGVTGNTQSAGGDPNDDDNTMPHNNMPPYYAVHFIIKAK